MARRAAEPERVEDEAPVGTLSASPAEPAFYVKGRGRWRDIKALLHPPYTAWHLSYVAVGAVSGPRFSWLVLAGTLLSFFLAVGIASHSLDELHGRPLRTALSSRALAVATGVSLAGAVAIGAVGMATRVGPGLAIFIAVGAFLVAGYSLELFSGRLHTDLAFALAWGSFPVLTAAYAENKALPLAAIPLAAAAGLLSAAQRSLSTPARILRRQVISVEGQITSGDGAVRPLDRQQLLAPLEKSLRLLSFAMVLLAVGLVVARTVHWRW